MALGTQLGTMVDMLRKEVGDATNAALGANAVDHYKQVLRRVQAQLWEDYDWPNLKLRRTIQLQAGVRYYAFPDDIPQERITGIFFRNGATWIPLKFGISEEEYTQINSDANMRMSIVQKWDFYEGDLFEVWPIPAVTGSDLPGVDNNIRIRGIQKLTDLISETDRAIIDDVLIVLTAAAEILERRKSADAGSKKQLAAMRFATLKSRWSQKDTFQLGGEDESEKLRPPVVAAYTRS